MSVQLKVSEISAASPDMDDDQFNELVEDIRKHGQLVPIWKSGDEIIDGRKRARACSILGIACRTVEMPINANAEELSYALNILRTHYTNSQRAIFAAKMVNSKIGRPKRQQNSTDIKVDQKIDFRSDEAGALVGVSDIQVRRAKRIQQEGSAEIVAAVEQGKINLSQAQQIINDIPKRQHASAIAEKTKKENGPSKWVSRRTQERKLKKTVFRMRRSLDQLNTVVALVLKFVSEPGAARHEDCSEWVSELMAIKSTVTKIIRKIGGGIDGE